MKTFKIVFVVFLIFSMAIPELFSAQSEASGEPVPGAEVYVELEPDDEPIANVTTNSEGEFEFSFPPGIKIPQKGEFSFTITPPKKKLSSKTKKVAQMKKQTIKIPFSANADKKFKYILIWEIDSKAENKGAFAISGKNST